MANPTIKVSADLSSFEQELNNLKGSIDSLGEKLKTATGKTDFNFNGSTSDLNKLIAQADKLTRSLDTGDKTSAKYLKNLQAMQKALQDAAKVSAKLEEAGTTNNHNASNYFREFGGEIAQESGAISSARALEADRARTAARLESDRQETSQRWANRASSVIGVAGGALMGGGSGLSIAGSGIGSMIGSLFGAPGRIIGAAAGGLAGGLADSTLSVNKQEALRYSELTRSMGGISVDFEHLRDSVRKTIEGFGVTNIEAAVLAKNFAKTANLSSDINDDISKSVGTSTGMAQGYGIAPDKTTDFFANMRINGVGKNDQDNKRLALQIGEAVARSGTSVKMDETLSAISSFTAKSASQTMTTPDFGTFTSMLTAMTGSNYAGLRGNVGGSAGILDKANSGVLGFGSAGEASQFQWMQAQQNAMPGLNWLDVSSNQSNGLLGSLKKTYEPGSVIYDEADESTKKQYDELNDQLGTSGIKNMLDVGIKQVDSISRNSRERNKNMKQLFGMSSEQEAASLYKFHAEMQPNGRAEEILKKNGITLDNLDPGKISALATTVSGSAEDRQGFFKSIRGRLSKENMDEGDKALAGGDDSLQKFLLKAIRDGAIAVDPGLDAQKASVTLQQKMANSMTSLVDISNMAKEAMIEILRVFNSNSPLVKKEDGRKELERDLDIVRQGGTKEERGLLAEQLKKDMWRKGVDNYPVDMEDQLQKSVDGVPVDEAKSSSSEKATIPAWSGGNSGSVIRAKVIAEATKQGVPAEKALALLQMESVGGTRLQGPTMTTGSHKGDAAYGPFQYMKSSSVGWDRYNDDENIAHGVGDLKRNYKKYHKWDLAYAAHHGGNGVIKNGAINPKATDGYISTVDYAKKVQSYENNFSDQLPESHKQPSEGPRNHNFKGEFVLRDSKGNTVADPIYHSASIGAPKASGTSWKDNFSSLTGGMR